jgi:hypothetical protein
MKTFLLALVLVAMVTGTQGPAVAQLAVQVTHMGYRCNEGGGGSLDAVWTTGNLGNMWNEGEWVPYQIVITGIQSTYPNFTGMPDIGLSFDFTVYDARFVDLIRAIQVGTAQLDDTEGFPDVAGSPLPVVTREDIEYAQNYLGEWEWQLGGDGDFTFLYLPHNQIMRDEISGDGGPLDARKYVRVTPADILAAGIPATSDTIVVYYQLHEARTFVWADALQATYDQPPTISWGGYLYSLPVYATDARNGAGFAAGSSGAAEVSFVVELSVPIPIPAPPDGIVSGMKWEDADGDGVLDAEEDMLSGWRIYIAGALEGLDFFTSTVTGAGGEYSFTDLTPGLVWTVKEEGERYDPHEIGYTQTYPIVGVVIGQATGATVAPPPAGVSPVGWVVDLTTDFPEQSGLGFGNMCFPSATQPITWGGIKSLYE